MKHSSPAAQIRRLTLLACCVGSALLTTSCRTAGPAVRGFRDLQNSPVSAPVATKKSAPNTLEAASPVSVESVRTVAAPARAVVPALPPKPVKNARAQKTASEAKPTIESQMVAKIGSLGIRAGYVSLTVIVKSVAPGSTADRAGIKPGDLLLRIGGLDPSVAQMDALKPLTGEIGKDVVLRWKTLTEIREASLAYGEIAPL